MRVVEVLGLAYRYGRVPALEDLRLEVEEGDIYGFLGPNGAGKTTALRILLGLLRPQGGTVRLLGRDLRTHALEVLAQVGAHLESHSFYPYLTGREHLRLFAHLAGNPVDAAWGDELLERVGLGPAADRKVRGYSLGMRQRLGLAQALVHRPRLLLLDEPMNGLDPPGVLEIRNLLMELHRQEGLTILMATHRLDEVERLCTRVGLIRNGRMVVEAPLRELLAPPGEARFLLETSDDARAQELLAREPWVRRAVLADGRLRVAVDPAARHRVARRLVEAGLDVAVLAPERPGLEELFLRYEGSA